MTAPAMSPEVRRHAAQRHHQRLTRAIRGFAAAVVASLLMWAAIVGLAIYALGVLS